MDKMGGRELNINFIWKYFVVLFIYSKGFFCAEQQESVFKRKKKKIAQRPASPPSARALSNGGSRLSGSHRVGEGRKKKLGQNVAKDLNVENVHLCLLKRVRLRDWSKHAGSLTWGEEHLYFETSHKDFFQQELQLIAGGERQPPPGERDYGCQEPNISPVQTDSTYGFYE